MALLTVKQLCEKYNLRQPSIATAIKKKEIPVASRVRPMKVDEREVVAWINAKSDKDRSRMKLDMEVLKKEQKKPAEAEREASGGGIFSSHQLDMLQGVHVPDDLHKQARGVNDLAKALVGLIDINERRAALMQRMGRLIDLEEAEVLINNTLQDFRDEVRNMAVSWTEDIALQVKLPAGDTKKILEAVTEKLVALIEETGKTMQRNAEQIRVAALTGKKH